MNVPILFKVPLLAAHLVSLRVAMTAPTPKAKSTSTERKKYTDEHKTFELPMPYTWGPPTFRGVGYSIIGLEIVAILIAAYHEAVDSSTFKPAIDHFDVLRGVGGTSISAPFLFGTAMSVFGAAVRASCYHHMGKHFTFELTLQKDHQLVTSGPYSVVRHPSYIGIFAFYFGSVLSLFGPGSFWLAADLWEYPIAKLLGAYYILYAIYVGAVLFARVSKEDEVLRREFKDQWASWANRTPYRLIPFVY